MDEQEWPTNAISRLNRAIVRLEEKRDVARGFEKSRLEGKIEGVKLARSYISDTVWSRETS